MVTNYAEFQLTPSENYVWDINYLNVQTFNSELQVYSSAINWFRNLGRIRAHFGTFLSVIANCIIIFNPRN